MVGFGSSLRLSRRRGWEDAYLDYPSLRLLLTQIEAVYEEEDWKRAAQVKNEEAANDGSDEEDGGDGEGVSEWARPVYGAWRAVRRRVRRYNTPAKRRTRFSRPMGGGAEEGNLSGWVSSEYLNSPDRHRRKREKDKGAAALDRGGWRTPGVMDYRDELFLVSDEEAAYGFDEEVGNTDEGEEWEDEEESIDEEEGQYCDNEVGKYEGDFASDRIAGFVGPDGAPRKDDVEGTNGDPKRGRSGSEALSMVEEEPDRSSPTATENNASGKVLQTPDTKKSKVQFSDSPGVLETGYETFATAAERRGLVSPVPMTVGSPSEQGGWHDFITNLLPKGKDKAPSELDPLLLKQQDSPGRSGSLNNSLLDHSPVNASPYGDRNVVSALDSPSRYTHFAEKFSTLRSPSEDIGPMPPPPLDDAPSPPRLTEEDRLEQPESGLNAMFDRKMNDEHLVPLTPIDTPLLSDRNTIEPSMPPVEATKLGHTLPLTPMTPPMSPNPPSSIEKDTRIGGFGVALKMIPTESDELLRPNNSPTKGPGQADAGLSQFYSFKNEDTYGTIASESAGEYQVNLDPTGEYDAGDEDDRRDRSGSNMISFYSGGSVRSPTKMHGQRPGSRRHHNRQEDMPQSQTRMPSLARDISGGGGGNFILGFFLGNANDAKKKAAASRHSGARARSLSSERLVNQRLAATRQKRAAVAARRRRARLRREKQLRRRRERVPEHLRLAHARAAAITERFRGLLRAEVEKVILFANSRLGELADTMGSLRYSSYEDGQGEMRKEYPSLADGGMHVASSSEDGDSGSASVSSDELGLDDDLDGSSAHRILKSDSSNDETKKQILLRDRLRISRPMFQKADFLGEDFSLLSAVDEADAYTAVGVELMHLLKYVCVNIIAVRKICKKHDRLLSNRMLGGYYQRLAAEARMSQSDKRGHQNHLIQMTEAQPQFGGTLSNPTSSAGYIFGIYDTKIQHIANSTTMQTVSSSLAVALDECEASHSRSNLLGLGFGTGPDGATGVRHAEPAHSSGRATSRLRDVVAYQISGQCFRGDSNSSVASEESRDIDNASSSSNTALTRLQFVVTSIFGLREAARSKHSMFEHYSSRLLMMSTGPNVAGDGLDGCSRETLDFLCSYEPDAAYTLDQVTLCSALGRGKDGIGGVMVASLAAAAKGFDLTANRNKYQRHVAATMSINPQATGEEDGATHRSAEYQNILVLNASSLVLFLANYYVVVPTAHISAITLGSRNSGAALIGITNVAVIISAFIHSLVTSRRGCFLRKPSSYLRTHLEYFSFPLVACSAFGVAGNILHSVSLTKSSLGMALAGRFLVGLSSAQSLNLHLLRALLPQESVSAEAAALARLSFTTMPLAFAFGSLFDIRVSDTTITRLGAPLSDAAPANASPKTQPSFSPLPFGQRRLFSLESMGYVMAASWFIHLVGMAFFFDLPKSKRSREREPLRPELKLRQTTEEDFDSDEDMIVELPHEQGEEINHRDGTFEKLQTMARHSLKRLTSPHSYRESIANVRRLVFSNVAFPTMIAILFIGRTMAEVLTSSCGTILARYFDWSGARSGLFMGVMACSILPINKNLASERYFAERNIIKVALEIARYGMVLMLNYESLFHFVKSIFNSSLRRDASYYYYDGWIGILQYLLSYAIVYCSVTTLEGATLSLTSKSCGQIKKYAIDNAFIVIVVSALGRLAGDALICTYEMSSWAFLHDIVNALCFSMIVVFTAGTFVVRRHFFFLI